ncbi:hypothetical protein GJ496_008113 [Pomphorhynchus laevis]|nr:hypothetical protein GJ496_008113 [Pomphorhynchus laevis]
MIFAANDAIYAVKFIRNALLFFVVSVSCYFVVIRIAVKVHSCYRYAIIFDAGSTATRIHIYRFINKPLETWTVKLSDEYFEETKPGISELSPDLVISQTEHLLVNALKQFPRARHSPIVYCATAGLRSLPDQSKALVLLTSVETALIKYSSREPNFRVTILSGKDEGLYSWITLSYLLLLTEFHNHMEITTIDMGGISMQMTCARPSNTSVTMQQPRLPSLNSVSLNNHGLVAARRKLIDNRFYDCMLLTKDANNARIAEGCIDVVKKTMAFESRTNACPSNNDIYLFSYFYDIALKANLVESNKGGSITLNSIMEAAEKWCTSEQESSNLMCLDLSYMYNTLNSTFNVKGHNKIRIVKKIKGIEVAWSLGLALSVLEDIKF